MKYWYIIRKTFPFVHWVITNESTHHVICISNKVVVASYEKSTKIYHTKKFNTKSFKHFLTNLLHLLITVYTFGFKKSYVSLI